VVPAVFTTRPTPFRDMFEFAELMPPGHTCSKKNRTYMRLDDMNVTEPRKPLCLSGEAIRAVSTTDVRKWG